VIPPAADIPYEDHMGPDKRDYRNVAPPYENLLNSVPTYSGKIGNREEYLR
jgi:hypothetical protein